MLFKEEIRNNKCSEWLKEMSGNKKKVRPVSNLAEINCSVDWLAKKKVLMKKICKIFTKLN
jgi:hypothetical protein